MERIVNAIGKDANRTSWKSGRIPPLRMPLLLQKKTWNPLSMEQQIPVGKYYVQMLCMTSLDLGEKQSKKSWEIVDMEKKKKVRGEVFQVSWRNLRANRHQTRGIKTIWWRRVPLNQCQMMRKKQHQKTNKQINIKQYGRRILIIQDFFWLVMKWTLL